MAQTRISFNINVRAMIWLDWKAKQSGMKLPNYISTVLLRHLEQLPEIDLGRSPYSEPKGVSNGKQDEGNNGRDNS